MTSKMLFSRWKTAGTSWGMANPGCRGLQATLTNTTRPGPAVRGAELPNPPGAAGERTGCHGECLLTNLPVENAGVVFIYSTLPCSALCNRCLQSLGAGPARPVLRRAPRCTISILEEETPRCASKEGRSSVCQEYRH